MEEGTCPICNSPLTRLIRYPLSICGSCASIENIKDASGNTVTFCNTDALGGGFASLHTINGKTVKKEENICFVKGIKCFAEEARFGGIIIQVWKEESY
jgi:hypothetical protein